MDNGVSYGILSIDNLSEDDIELFVSILDALNCWKDNFWSKNKKKNYLRNHCKKEMSQILIEVLKSKQIETEIRKIVDPLLRDPELRRILSAICFLSAISIEARFYILDEMIEEYEIKTLRRDENLKHFFSVDLLSCSVRPRSSVFSLFILRKYFDTAELSKIFLEFLTKINSKVECKDIRKQLLSFNTLERIFGNNKLASLYGYYEAVKYCTNSMINDSQYWLQVAMCHIARKKYDETYNSLNRAYDEAKKTTRYKYKTEKIDNQMVRLLVKQSLIADNSHDAFELFLKADNLPRKQSFSVYKYKIIFEYSGFFDEHFSVLDVEEKETIKKICSIYLKECEEKQRGEKSWREEIIFERCQSMLKKYAE
ncbi:Uncharacterised protein [Helicobacter pametensis]|nr:Uncharacterised protein [Helicobacter pametensis]